MLHNLISLEVVRRMRWVSAVELPPRRASQAFPPKYGPFDHPPAVPGITTIEAIPHPHHLLSRMATISWHINNRSLHSLRFRIICLRGTSFQYYEKIIQELVIIQHPLVES